MVVNNNAQFDLSSAGSLPRFAGFDSRGVPLLDNVWRPQCGDAQAAFHDGVPFVRSLLGDGDANYKLAKNTIVTKGLSLAPHKQAGAGNVCAGASEGCIDACLDGVGRAGVWAQIRVGRIVRTLLWFEARQWFTETLKNELARFNQQCQQADSIGAIRLNVFSDLPWERYLDLASYSALQFYDYTKIAKRAGAMAPNYWLTFSRSESNDSQCLEALGSACNVAVAFDCGRTGRFVSGKATGADLPETWNGYPVIDGDSTDLRFLDSRGRKHGRVVGLRLKARSTHDRLAAIASGFAVSRFHSWREAHWILNYS